MNNLLDVIRQNKASLLNPAPEQDQTLQVQKLLQAKSGRAVGNSQYTPSNLSEQQANNSTNQQLRSLAIPAQIATQGLEQASNQIAREEQQQLGQVAQARSLNTLQNKIRIDSTLGDLERNLGKIDQSREEATKEQVAFNLRLDNKKYLDNLKIEGEKARLGNELVFREYLAKDVFAGNEELFKDGLNGKSILDAKQRDFDREMSQMDLGQAWEVYKRENDAQNDRAKWEAFGNIFQVGVGAASSSGGNSGSGSSNSGNSEAKTSSAPSSGGE